MKSPRRIITCLLVTAVAFSLTTRSWAGNPKTNPPSTDSGEIILERPDPPTPPAPAPKPSKQKGKRKPSAKQQIATPNPNDDQRALEPPPAPSGETLAPITPTDHGVSRASTSIAPRGPIIEINGVNGNFTITVHEVDINNLQWTDMKSNHDDNYQPQGQIEMCLVGSPGTSWTNPNSWIPGHYDPATNTFTASVKRAFKPGTDKPGDDDGQKFQVVARDGSARGGTPMGGWWKVDWDSNVDWTDFSYHDTGGRISITADQSGRLSPTEGVPHTYQDALRWHGQRAQKYIP